ncbi:hypothetical protein HYW11_00695 [Candidatus Peregrinibacteria bacterium]|nr:hypothetical protein [Candidatus Peregrinibacteria bacterium]
MNRQSQQLVVASVVAFLTSGVITLAGLSAAQDSMHMGTYMEPTGSTSYTPPADGGGTTYQEPTNTYHPMDTYTQPAGDFSNYSGTQPTGSTFTQPTGDSKIQWDGQTFQKDGADFQMHGAGFQKDGSNFQRDGFDFQKDGAGFHQGAPDFGGKTGAERGFRGGFEGKEGMERAGGRFDRKPTEGFGETEQGVFGKGTSYPMKGGQGGKEKEGIFGKGTTFPMKGGQKENIFGKDTQWPIRGEHAGAEDGNVRGSPNFDMSQFDQFVPKKSNANVDSLLESLPTGESDSAPTLTAAQESKVENTLDKADAAETKAVSGLQKIFDKKPTKSAATKATNHILTLVKQWMSVQKLADGLGDYESDVADHADASATSFANTIVEACDAASDFFDGKWKGEKVCDKVQEQMHAAAGEEESE